MSGLSYLYKEIAVYNAADLRKQDEVIRKQQSGEIDMQFLRLL